MRFWPKTGAVLALAAVVLLGSGVDSAFAWTEVFTSFDYDGNLYCGSISAYDSTSHRGPCLFWQENHYTSITIQTYLSTSLNLGYYDFTPAANRAFTDINGVQNWGPYMNGCSNCSANAPVAYYTGTRDCYVLASTFYDLLSTPSEYTTTMNIGYYQFIQSAHTVFNSYPTGWNNTLTWAQYPNCDFAADGRKVATHETGHVQGLGHTNTTSVVHQGPEQSYALQSDDKAGLIAIYPGYQPAS